MLDVEFVRLSTDTKPVTAKDKDMLYETDTGLMPSQYTDTI